MDRATLESKLEGLTRQYEETAVNLHRIGGAIAIVKQLLAEHESPDSPSPKETTPCPENVNSQ